MTGILILVVITFFILIFSGLVVLTLIGAGYFLGVARFFDEGLDWFSRFSQEKPITLQSLIPIFRFWVIMIIVLLMALLQIHFFDPHPPATLFDFQWRHARYLIPPLWAVFFIVIAGGRFIQDIFNLPFFRPGLAYFASSLFGFQTPNLVINNGKPQTAEGEFNPILSIGGPGTVQIQPGNAVVFQSLREITRTAQVSSTYLNRFETIAHIAVLDDQHDQLTDFGEKRQFGYLVTRDGIRIILREVNFRFRIIPNAGITRTIDNPYPFDPQALMRMATNLSVDTEGPQTIRQAVRLLVGTAIRDELRDHTVNELTAPQGGRQNPLNAISNSIMLALNTWSIGVEVFMMDLGHIEIVEGGIQESRMDAWASHWVGNAGARQAYADGIRQAYEEYGRAQAQTEMIMSIAHSLDGIDLGANPAHNIRLLLLSRTAQVLQSFQSVKEEKDDYDD
jgi:hypothetical protein